MPQIQGKWLWYELMTSNAAATKSFYEAVIGWKIAPGTEPPMFYGMIARQDGTFVGGVLPISAEMVAQGARPAWVGYVGVDDVDATLGVLTARGGHVLSAKMTIDEGSFALVADPDGAPFYLMAPNPKPGEGPSTAFSMAHVGSCSWNELYASDAEAALGFYGALFGWEQMGEMDMGAAGTYRFIAAAGQPIGAIMPRPAHIPVAHWNHYWRVENIGVATAAITAHGGVVLAPPHEVPGGDWIVHAKDPQGAAFCLVGKAGAP